MEDARTIHELNNAMTAAMRLTKDPETVADLWTKYNRISAALQGPAADLTGTRAEHPQDWQNLTGADQMQALVAMGWTALKWMHQPTEARPADYSGDWVFADPDGMQAAAGEGWLYVSEALQDPGRILKAYYRAGLKGRAPMGLILFDAMRAALQKIGRAEQRHASGLQTITKKAEDGTRERSEVVAYSQWVSRNPGRDPYRAIEAAETAAEIIAETVGKVPAGMTAEAANAAATATNAVIWDMFKSGHKMTEIGRAVGMSSVAVKKRLAKMAERLQASHAAADLPPAWTPAHAAPEVLHVDSRVSGHLTPGPRTAAEIIDPATDPAPEAPRKRRAGWKTAAGYWMYTEDAAETRRATRPGRPAPVKNPEYVTRKNGTSCFAAANMD